MRDLRMLRRAGVRVIDRTRPRHGHDHGHGHGHGPRHEPGTGPSALEVDMLANNDRAGRRQPRAGSPGAGSSRVNLMSSPGSGKTTLLERTIATSAASCRCAVLEGDQETLLDAERIGATGARVVQINTGAGCHLDAAMVARGCARCAARAAPCCSWRTSATWSARRCSTSARPARVVIMSVTEGADKPLKYPHMFRTADLVLLNKIDLLPYVDFDVARCVEYARRARPAWRCWRSRPPAATAWTPGTTGCANSVTPDPQRHDVPTL